MLRDKNLVPLSHQHHRSLALCVRMDRALQAGEAALEAWQDEMARTFEEEIRVHFEAEERVLLPKAAAIPELSSLVTELLAEHGLLRDYFGRAAGRQLGRVELQDFARMLSEHIRKEERQLFERCQKFFSAGEMAEIGTALLNALQETTNRGASCAVPNPATRLRARRRD
jgi:hemerythrin-like domain-containing protein